MGVEKREVVTYTCDRCGFELDGAVIRNDEAINCGPSSREFWVAQAAPEHSAYTLRDPQTPRTWLCATCVRDYHAFITGAKLSGWIDGS